MDELDKIIDKYRINTDIPQDVIDKARKEYEENQKTKEERESEKSLPRPPIYGFHDVLLPATGEPIDLGCIKRSDGQWINLNDLDNSDAVVWEED